MLVAAGLEKSTFRKYSNEELFEEMERMWIKLGHQPSIADFDSQGTSVISSGTYLNRFGGWRELPRIKHELFKKIIYEKFVFNSWKFV